MAIVRAHAQTVDSAMHDNDLKFKVQIARVLGDMDMDATMLKGGCNERPCEFVKRLEVIGKFIVIHNLRKTGRDCERGRARTSNRAGGGALTKGGVSHTVNPLAHAKTGGRERTGHGCSFSNLWLPM